MGGFGGFYKGEKKKSKKGKEANKSVGFGAPVFTLPELVSKKRKDQ